MKTCSYCGGQNEDAAVRCSGCGTEFPAAESSSQEPAEVNQPLVILATFGDVSEASVLKAQLELAGIEACIPEELDPTPFGNFPAHVTVRVAEKDLAAAKEVMGSTQ